MAINVLSKKSGQSIGLITLDAVISSTITHQIDVTDHEVERGANIADHARIKPRTLSLQCLISNTPTPGQQANRVIKLVGVDFRSNVSGDQATKSPGYARAAYDELLRLRAASEIVSVVTDLDRFESMLITNISIPRDARTGDALSFTVELKEIRLVSNLITNEKITKTDRAKTKKKKDPPTTEATESEVVSSWAAQLNDFGGDPLKTREFARKKTR
jgi:hypothetical protein